jgi:uncharacterized membrane protein YgdD (TMEM256/DUF423 family)
MAMAASAYAAHGVTGQSVDWIEKAARLQLVHAVLLAAIGLSQAQGRALQVTAGLIAAGILLFCGALYLMALFSAPVVFLVPIGGTCFILGWVALGFVALKK